jgi:hypothetical protein
MNEGEITLKNPNRFIAAAAVASSLALAACGGAETDVAATSQALDVAPCFDLVATLKTQTQVVVFASAKDQTGLLGKLDDAAQKLSLGKLADAVLKLQDYSAKVQQLVAQGKIRAGTAADGTAVTPQDLLDGAAMAIACIQPV